MKARSSRRVPRVQKVQLGEDKHLAPGITAIEVEGFKSLAKRTRVEVWPLTILAGANSSGKSSAMQGLLLLKQTLDASYDPGPLLLRNSHVKFSSIDQLISRVDGKRSKRTFEFAVESRRLEARLDLSFRRQAAETLELRRMDLSKGERALSLAVGMSQAELRSQLPFFQEPGSGNVERGKTLEIIAPALTVARDRCFLRLARKIRVDPGNLLPLGNSLLDHLADLVRQVLHLPGLRGNPERAYPTTAAGPTFPGTFDIYTASVILSWQKHKDIRLGKLDRIAKQLGLTWRVRARQLGATWIEVLVGRLPRKGEDEQDLVNLADVGFGVSQVLPVMVALLQAQPGQMVYVEQPELHLHPRAQIALAGLLVEAANRGVRVVAETHSSLLLLSLQTLVAQGRIEPEKTILHWFERSPDGSTKVTSGKLDRQGAYGDWPEDFGEVEAKAEGQYLDTVEDLLGVR